MARPAVRVCFVCSGNICRSPTAEVVLGELVREAGLEASVRADSAGTGGWHAGDDMDERSRRTLRAAGYEPGPHVAKQFEAGLFAERDVVVALDSGHYAELQGLTEDTDDPAAARAKIVMLRAYDPDRAGADDLDVADPYYGGPQGFETVLAQIERSCAALLAALTDG